MALPRYRLDIDADTLSDVSAAAGAAWSIDSVTDDGIATDAGTVVGDSASSGTLDSDGRGHALLPASPPASRYILRIPAIGVSAALIMPAANADAAVRIDLHRRQAEAIPISGLTPAVPRPGEGGVHTDATLDGDGTQTHPLAVTHPFTAADGDAIADAAGSAAAAQTAAQGAVDAVAQETADRADADTALAQRIDSEAQARADADAELTRRVETAGSKLVDLHVVEREAWVDADEAVAAFADVTGSREAADRIRNGQLPLNLDWQVRQEFNDEGGGAADVELVFRLSRAAGVRRADYRLRRGDSGDAPRTRLDSNTIGLFASDAQYAYRVLGGRERPTPWGNVPADTTFVLEHHGTATHTSYGGETPVETGRAKAAESVLDDRVSALEGAPSGGISPAQAKAIADNSAAVAALADRLADDEDALAMATHIEVGAGAPTAATPGETPRDFYLDTETGRLYQYSRLTSGYVVIEDFVIAAELAAALATKQDTLTQAQLVDLLQFDLVPGVVVGYTLAEQPAARRADWLTDWRVWVSGGDTVGDVWLSVRLEGQALAAAPRTPGTAATRVKLDATNTYQFTLADAQRTNLIDGRSNRRQGRDIEVGLFFYDAAQGGRVIDSKTLAVDWLPMPESSGGGPAVDATARGYRIADWGTVGGGASLFLEQADGDRAITIPLSRIVNQNTLSAAAQWAKIGAIDSTAGLRNNEVLALAAAGTTIVMRNSMRLPAGVAHDNDRGLLTLPIGVWRVTARAVFRVTAGQRANLRLAVLVDVEGPTAEALLSASRGYDYRNDPGGDIEIETSSILQVTDLGSGNDTAVLRATGSFTGGGVAAECRAAVLEVERIA